MITGQWKQGHRSLWYLYVSNFPGRSHERTKAREIGKHRILLLHGASGKTASYSTISICTDKNSSVCRYKLLWHWRSAKIPNDSPDVSPPRLVREKAANIFLHQSGHQTFLRESYRTSDDISLRQVLRNSGLDLRFSITAMTWARNQSRMRCVHEIGLAESSLSAKVVQATGELDHLQYKPVRNIGSDYFYATFDCTTFAWLAIFQSFEWILHSIHEQLLSRSLFHAITHASSSQARHQESSWTDNQAGMIRILQPSFCFISWKCDSVVLPINSVIEFEKTPVYSAKNYQKNTATGFH